MEHFKKDCNIEKIKAKVGVYVCLLEISIITTD